MNVYIGFGIPATQEFARFSVLADPRSGVYPDWETPSRYIIDPIVGSDDFEVQMISTGEGRLTLNLEFDNREQFQLFRSMKLKKRTLVLFAGFTSHEGPVHTWDRHNYEYFTDTVLLEIGRPEHHVDGVVECSATFIRSAAGMGVSL